MRSLRSLWIVPVLVAAALGYIALDEGAGFSTWWDDRAGLEVAHGRIAELEAEIHAWEREAVLLEGDPFAIERAIREELRFARAGETVVRLAAPSGTNHRFP